MLHEGISMQAMPIRIFLIIFILFLIRPSALPAAMEQRIALVIGNGSYSSGPLKNPVNDAVDMAAMLKKLGFSVTLKKNAGLQEMDEAIEAFGNRLKRGGVGLFYYAGHGVQVNGVNYLLPIGAKINKEADVKYQAVDANKILDEMATANNGLNIVMLDACRDNPFVRSFRNAARGLAIVSSAPSGTFISYSTSPGNVARDGDGRNSPYTAALLKYMQAPGLTISDVFINVRSKVKKETGQVPWELSSLEGNFFFNPSKSSEVTEKRADDTEVQKTNYEAEQRRLDEERQKLQREKDLLEQRKALVEEERRLQEERNRLEEGKKKLAYVPVTGSRFVNRINARVTEVKFFEGPYHYPPKEQRVYNRNFSRTMSRYIWWELNLEHPAAGRRIDYKIESIWYGTHGNEFFRDSLDAYVNPDSRTSWWAKGYGWREFSSSNWQTGSYRVDIYIDGEKIASDTFNIY
jgi:uncharacterized caspase-like protein